MNDLRCRLDASPAAAGRHPVPAQGPTDVLVEAQPGGRVGPARSPQGATVPAQLRAFGRRARRRRRSRPDEAG